MITNDYQAHKVFTSEHAQKTQHLSHIQAAQEHNNNVRMAFISKVVKGVSNAISNAMPQPAPAQPVINVRSTQTTPAV